MRSNFENDDATAPVALTIFIIIFLIIFCLILFPSGGLCSSCGKIYKVIVEEEKSGDKWVPVKRKTVLQGGDKNKPRVHFEKNESTSLPSANEYEIL